MFTEGKAVGQNDESRVTEGRGWMGEGVTMMTGCHGDNCIPYRYIIWPRLHISVFGKCLVYRHMTKIPVDKELESMQALVE